VTAVPTTRAPDLGAASPRLFQRALVVLLIGGTRLLQLLPDGLVYRSAAGLGVVLWLLMPKRRRLVRRNLQHVCGALAAEGHPARTVGAAAGGGRALDALVRAAFGHWVRTYAESAVAPRYDRGALTERVLLETPDAVSAAMAPLVQGGTGRVLVGFHFGSVELAALFASRMSSIPVVGPMERVSNPVMRAYFERTRHALGIELLPPDGVARHLSARLARGEAVALVADRAIGGGGAAVDIFGRRARLPLGPAALAVESGAPMFVIAVWRTGWRTWAARVEPIDPPAEGTRRERIRTLLEAEARLLEQTVALAPEQWWSLFFEIWPD
jgi:phosphatidylinositol dimannoside acyltransferase